MRIREHGPLPDEKGSRAGPADHRAAGSWIRLLARASYQPVQSQVRRAFRKRVRSLHEPGCPVGRRALAVGIVLRNTVAWYGAVAMLLSQDRMRRVYESLERPINRASGVVMLGFGARLLLIHRGQ